MKKLLLVTVILISFLIAEEKNTHIQLKKMDLEINELYQKAIEAKKQGKTEEAKKHWEKMLKLKQTYSELEKTTYEGAEEQIKSLEEYMNELHKQALTTTKSGKAKIAKKQWEFLSYIKKYKYGELLINKELSTLNKEIDYLTEKATAAKKQGDMEKAKKAWDYMLEVKKEYQKSLKKKENLNNEKKLVEAIGYLLQEVKSLKGEVSQLKAEIRELKVTDHAKKSKSKPSTK